ncbi:hypothetical protein M758_12G132700 [Ceratodon purpureus]|nr:hypothetical protein M758_12G132700 [Ceratodon purpureus]
MIDRSALALLKNSGNHPSLLRTIFVAFRSNTSNSNAGGSRKLHQILLIF